LDGGYGAHRAAGQAGLIPITIVYESGAVITLPPKHSWVRGQLAARELDQLRELGARTNLTQYAGKDLTAVNGSDKGSMHVFSTVSGAPVEVTIHGYSSSAYGDADWEHGSTPAPLARLVDALFELREIASIPYVMPSARMRIVQMEDPCESKCPWPKTWPAPAVGVREVPLHSGDPRELDTEWEETCPPKVRGGLSRPRPRAFCPGNPNFAWCSAPVFPGVTDNQLEDEER
jgi:hypothetical protein